MKLLGAVILTFWAAGLVSAQAVNGFGNVVFPGLGHAPIGGNPWGNVVFPAGGAPPGISPFSSITDTGFAGRLGGIVSGFRPYDGAREGRHRGFGGGFGGGIYAYPVFVGGGYGYGGYDQGAPPQQPNVTVVVPPSQPPVIINNNFGPPPAPDQGQASDSSSNMRLYRAPSNADEPAPTGDTSYYLIAMKDHSIYSAVAYYVEGDTLHYFTTGNVHNQASLALVDRLLTEQLNHERNVDVRLPH